MKRFGSLALVFFLVLPVFTQDTITLYDCYTWCDENYPLVKQKALNRQRGDLKTDNIISSWYPQLSLNGRASYQSDVIELSFDQDIPGMEFPGMPHDQYKLYLSLNQSIYDGGIVRARGVLEDNQTETAIQQVEISLYEIKNQLNHVYFNILLLQKNKQVMQLTLEELKKRRKAVLSGVENGVLLLSDLDLMDAERLKLEQQLVEVETGIESLYSVLAELTGRDIDTTRYLALPDEPVDIENEIRRPEIRLYQLQKKTIDAGQRVIDASYRPKIYAFGETGYGKPGLNYFNEEFKLYYIAGLGLSWNFMNWGDHKRQQKINDLQKQSVDVQMENFTKNVNISLVKERAKIVQYKKSLEKDREIVRLRSKIRQNAAERMDKGVITSTAYITELNAELIAKLKQEIHRIKMIETMYNCLLIGGIKN